jgi:cardiolipin synthase
MLVGVYVTLGVQSYIALWLVILIVFRDVLIVGGTVLSQLIDRPVKMQPLFISKVNTVAQIVLAAGVLAELTFEFADMPVITALEYLVAVTTVTSGTCYLYMWVTGRGAFIDVPVSPQNPPSSQNPSNNQAVGEEQPRGRA